MENEFNEKNNTWSLKVTDPKMTDEVIYNNYFDAHLSDEGKKQSRQL